MIHCAQESSGIGQYTGSERNNDGDRQPDYVRFPWGRQLLVPFNDRFEKKNPIEVKNSLLKLEGYKFRF